MPVTCPRCGAPGRSGAPSCGDCKYVLASAASTFLTLTFPAEHPDYDLSPDTQPPAPAPTLMPGPPALPYPPPVPEAGPARSPWKTVPAVVGAVAFVVVVGIAVSVALLGSRDNGQLSGTLPGDDRRQQVVDSTVPGQDSSGFPPTSTPNPVPTDEKSARQMLRNQVADDHAKVEALTEHWVPQLSSKRLGLEVNGTVFNYRAIWSDFTRLAARYPGAMLLWSGDYSSFRLPNFWVTIAPQPFASGELANAWCDSAGIPRDDCYAKRITHIGTHHDSTLLR